MESTEKRDDGRPRALGGRLKRAAGLIGLATVTTIGLSACASSPEGASPAGSGPPATSSPVSDPNPRSTGVPPLVCGTASPPARPDPQRTGPPVTITDRGGHEWDISTAVYKYGFEAGEFDYGLGVNVIRPIVGPDFLAPGDEGYPGAGDDFELVGVERGGEARAYPLGILTRHEIVNDFIGGDYLAVGY